MAFFHYSQNNSGGSFDLDEQRGITHHVVIEADSADHANARAESIGLYFDGLNDCPCCGNRWSEAWGDDEGTDEPTVYGDPVAEQKDTGYKWMPAGKEIVVHYRDGRTAWH